MTTKKQLIANRKNAQKGGVKTQEGKELVKFNALKHGILLQAVTEYEQPIYEDIQDRLINILLNDNTPEPACALKESINGCPCNFKFCRIGNIVILYLPQLPIWGIVVIAFFYLREFTMEEFRVWIKKGGK